MSGVAPIVSTVVWTSAFEPKSEHPIVPATQVRRLPATRSDSCAHYARRLGRCRLSRITGAVERFLTYLEEAFRLDTVRRYDLKGKKHLETNAKYYLGDIGLRHVVLGYRGSDIGGVQVNLVYPELRRRGDRVAVGTGESGQIDLVAEDRAGKLYIQVA
ncbi:MAG: ATP-binding protein [Spirochaetales bacterium]|nr:ATP-binding protein [Spirochaetales bacterium]